MWWGGLRGSVGLALGLAVHHTLGDKYMWGEGQTDVWGNVMFTTTLDCRDQPNMVLILTVFIVVMTVTINGVTMAPLMKLLKLTTVSHPDPNSPRSPRPAPRRRLPRSRSPVLLPSHTPIPQSHVRPPVLSPYVPPTPTPSGTR